MPDIYNQHKAAFAQVEAYVVCKGGERVATIAFKFPRDGAGRLYAYVHWIGLEMARGFAAGVGYDKRSAACAVAARKLLTVFQGPNTVPDRQRALDGGFKAFNEALATDGGTTFDRALREAGFTVCQAV